MIATDKEQKQINNSSVTALGLFSDIMQNIIHKLSNKASCFIKIIFDTLTICFLNTSIPPRLENKKLKNNRQCGTLIKINLRATQ